MRENRLVILFAAWVGYLCREYLNLMVRFDHDIVDGAPATRFTQRLKELIENGHGFEE